MRKSSSTVKVNKSSSSILSKSSTSMMHTNTTRGWAKKYAKSPQRSYSMEMIRMMEKKKKDKDDQEKNPEEEIRKMKELEDRIKAPSIWGRNPCGVRFEDLQDKRYEEAVRFLKKHYINEELTYKSLGVAEDKEATDEFIHNARIWMKDKMSIAVIKEGKEKLVGVLIMRIQEKALFSRTFSRVKLTYNPLYARIMKFLNEVEHPVDLFENLAVKRYLKIYVLALKYRYRHRGLAKELIRAAMNLARSAFIGGMAGIFTSGRMQQIAEEMGFEKFNEIYYVRYQIDNEIIFWDTGKGNYGAAIMGMRIPDVEEKENLFTVQSSRFNIGVGVDVEDEEHDGEQTEGEKEEVEGEEKKSDDDKASGDK